MLDECHISSLVVHVRPEREAEVSARIGRLAGAEVLPRQIAGKLIVTLETASTAEIVERLNAIHDLRGVISAALIYHHWESATDAQADAESEADHEALPPQVPQG
jgi:nitrate reductase NapD